MQNLQIFRLELNTLLLGIGTALLLFMAVIIYWFLTVVAKREPEGQDDIYQGDRTFNFEAAPEIMAYPINGESEPKENSLQLIKVQDSWVVCWSVQEKLLEKVDVKDGENYYLDDLVLRIYESDDLLRHHDITIKKAQGSCRLYLREHRAYYVSLGIKEAQKFHPLLVSNTIIPNEIS